MSQRISSPVSYTPSRLARIRSTAAYAARAAGPAALDAAGAGRAGSPIAVTGRGQVGPGERRRQQPAELDGPGVGVHQQAQAARLEQFLIAGRIPAMLSIHSFTPML